MQAGRWTHDHDGGVVVFLIGARINKPLAVRRWWPVISAMPRMLRELKESGVPNGVCPLAASSEASNNGLPLVPPAKSVCAGVSEKNAPVVGENCDATGGSP